MKAFITGSRAYGEPREDSDIDLVVLLSLADLAILEAASIERDEKGYASWKYGNLNLMAFCSTEKFEAWREATEKLKTRAPVSRKQAIRVFQAEMSSRNAELAELVARKGDDNV